MPKFVGSAALTHFWETIKAELSKKLDKTTYDALVQRVNKDLNDLILTKAEVDDLEALEAIVNGLKTSKQDKLTAGNGVTISGNYISVLPPDMIKKTLNEVGNWYKAIEYDSNLGTFILREVDTTGAESKDIKKQLATKDDIPSSITVDSSISSTSTNPVQNKVVKTELDKKVDKVSGKSLSTNDYTTAEKTKLGDLPDNATLASTYAKKTDITTAYRVKGSVNFSSLPAVTSATVGDVYNVKDAFTTTADFVEGAGKSYPTGSNVVCVSDSGTKKWDVLGGQIDLSPYLKTADLVELTNTEIDAITAG